MKPRTYSHLEGLAKRPTDYDVATTRLLYYLERGFEVKTPLAGWYARYQQASPLTSTRWEELRDPAETTYAKYTARQRDREVYVDGLLQAIETTKHDHRLPQAAAIANLLAPLRYPFHGLQMVGAYVGSMAPAGRIAIALALQAADDMRRVHRLAYRLRQLQLVHPEAGADARERWQSEPSWQPLRRVIERLLVTYDWGEAFVALDVVVRPAVDELCLARVARALPELGDELTPKILGSLYEDSAWQRDVTRAVLALVDPAQRELVVRWRDRWWREAAIDDAGVREVLVAYWSSLELGAPP